MLASLLRYSCRTGSATLCRLVLRLRPSALNGWDDCGFCPLHLALHRGHAHVARLLVEAGADPNKADWWGRPPLLLAFVADGSGAPTCTRLLLEARASPHLRGSPHLRDFYGLSPLEMASAHPRGLATLLVRRLGWCELMQLGGLLASALGRGEVGGGGGPPCGWKEGAFVDVWRTYVLPHVMLPRELWSGPGAPPKHRLVREVQARLGC